MLLCRIKDFRHSIRLTGCKIMAEFFNSESRIMRFLTRRRPYTPFLIAANIVLTALIITQVKGRLQEYLFFFFGFAIFYGAVIYGVRRGAVIAGLCYAVHTAAIYPEMVEEMKKVIFLEILVDRFIVVFLYFLSLLFMAQLVLNERALKERYRNLAFDYSQTVKELAVVNANINELYTSTIQALATAIEAKDPYTKGHSERVTKYAVAIAREMGLSSEEVRQILYAAILHDIGKIGVSGDILRKPGALSEEERDFVKKHPEIGAGIISSIRVLKEIVPIVLYHHERFDGKGYPGGKKGEEIPLGARIIAVADAFDAMTSDRPYRPRMTVEQAREEIVRNAGTQFDPQVVEAFLRVLEREEQLGLRAKQEAAAGNSF